MSTSQDRSGDHHRQVEHLITNLYDAVRRGDRSRFDSHLDRQVTTWESHIPMLLRGLDELDTYRDQRATAGAQPALASLDAEDLLIDVHDSVAVARYRLIARGTDDTVRGFRVTDVLRRDEGG